MVSTYCPRHHLIPKLFHRCEVQFDYGLRQKRFKKLEDRPASFTSAQGKEIFVEKKVAAKNEIHITRGKVR